jgi:hypothetical protein
MVVKIVVVGAVDSPDSISTNETLVPSEQLGDGAAESLICSVGKMNVRTVGTEVELRH